jgi:tripartite-type tricarboxylate transporter receptor subunit TctC
VLAALHAAVLRTVAHPDVTAGLMKQELQPVTSTPAEFTTFLKAEVDKWAKVIRVAKIPVE